MTEQPEALRLADNLINCVGGSTTFEAALKLRRLHEVNVELFRLVNLVHGSFGGGNVMTFSEQDIDDFENAINKATGETE